MKLRVFIFRNGGFSGHETNPSFKKEGFVSVKSKEQTNKGKRSEGDYIDYEEVK